jgi:hypothetical protein
LAATAGFCAARGREAAAGCIGSAIHGAFTSATGAVWAAALSRRSFASIRARPSLDAVAVATAGADDFFAASASASASFWWLAYMRSRSSSERFRSASRSAATSVSRSFVPESRSFAASSRFFSASFSAKLTCAASLAHDASTFASPWGIASPRFQAWSARICQR